MHDKNLPWFLKDTTAKGIYNDPDASYLVLDVETSGGSPTDPKQDLILAAWTIVDPADDSVVTRYAWGDEFSQSSLLEDIKSVDFVVAHHAKYELQWLRRCGLELRDVLVYCTFLGQWVLDGNQTLPRNLAALCHKYAVSAKWDLIKLLWDTGLGTDEVPKTWLLEYCLQDIKSTREIFLKQRELVFERNQQHLVFQRCLTAAALADIEFNGMTLDKERVYAEYHRVTQRLEEVSVQLREITGGINLGSPKQLGEFLYGKLGFKLPVDHRGKPKLTRGGSAPTDTATILGLTYNSDDQRIFAELYREYNRLDSLLSKNLEFFRGVCDEYDCNFRGIFNQGIAQTHRLTSSGLPLLLSGDKAPRKVQFQNMPREYKKLFTVDGEDYLIAEADGSQLEFRVAADLGRDKTAFKEICNKEDIHANTAKALTDAGEPTTRQEAKSRTFRPLTYSGR